MRGLVDRHATDTRKREPDLLASVARPHTRLTTSVSFLRRSTRGASDQSNGQELQHNKGGDMARGRLSVPLCMAPITCMVRQKQKRASFCAPPAARSIVGQTQVQWRTRCKCLSTEIRLRARCRGILRSLYLRASGPSEDEEPSREIYQSNYSSTRVPTAVGTIL